MYICDLCKKEGATEGFCPTCFENQKREKPPRARVSNGLKGRTFGNNPEPLYPPLPKTGPSAQEQIEVLTRRVEALERRLARVEENKEYEDYGTCARCGDPIKDPDCSPILCGSCFASGA